MSSADSRAWSIVMAGGEGERTRPLIERWLGRHKPKQYCTFAGTRSLLQHTVDRADQIADPARRVTVVAETHRDEAIAQLSTRGGQLMLQPQNRGTGPGVFLGLAYVQAVDPGATVVIYPSDHFVWPESRFIDLIRESIEASQARPDNPILLGVSPDRPERDYGWILPDDPHPHPGGLVLRSVKAFREKPDADETDFLMSNGALWNTLIVIARVETLWALGWRHMPDIMPLFECLTEHIGMRGEADVLDAIYARMPTRNFSSDLLDPAAAQLMTIEMQGLTWSDWGRPERILDTLSGIGKAPAFPVEPALAAAHAILPDLAGARRVVSAMHPAALVKQRA
jgi:mannose-1-phosphate guanylyltransferase